MDYKNTLNLPKTEFPMKANLSRREPEIQSLWDEKGLYFQMQKARKDAPVFLLHDGPPFANGNIHIGTALNKILKDIVVRFRTFQGYRSPYVPGWDCHGLPTELKAIENMGIKRHQINPVELRQRCKEYALKYVDLQRKEFKRLGVSGDWENPYLTLKPEYEAREIEVFGELARKGFLYRGLKPVFWCAGCETALAEFEVEYQDKVSPSLFVSFDVTNGKGVIPEGYKLIIWTTTPWTIPGNVGVAVHPKEKYGAIRTEKGTLVMGLKRMEPCLKEMGLTGTKLPQEWTGEEMDKIVLAHPLYSRQSLVILGDHVHMEEGTGCVHTAPGHGEEDFYACKPYDLPVLVPIDDKGIFTSDAGMLEGLSYDKSSSVILKALEDNNNLLFAGKITHSYPHCWRCKRDLLYRATVQWFASVEGFRQELLDAIDSVSWVPQWGKDRIYKMIENRPDWCISRQRSWGVPLPVFYCDKCGEPLITEDSIQAVADLFRKEGSNAWWLKTAGEILPEGTVCASCGHMEFTKETDIMDVWFDSGSSHASVMSIHPDLKWPAEIYLEGSDQHRGWFQSSLITGVATKNAPPYKTVLTHGFTVDGEGRKMSKSLGNVMYPNEVINKYGAEVLRLWAASSDYKGDIRVSWTIIAQMAEVYRKIRNTIRFLLGNLYDFDPDNDGNSNVEFDDIHKWAMGELNRLISKTTKYYETYDFHLLYHQIHNFCVLKMSSVYLDVLKDRLYCSAPGDNKRLASQITMYRILRSLLGLIAPLLPHTADEAWQFTPKFKDDPWSVHLLDWPKVYKGFDCPELTEKWNRLLQVRSVVTKSLENARSTKLIGSSLGSSISIWVEDDQTHSVLKEYYHDLPSLFIVSGVRIEEDGEGSEPLVTHSDNGIKVSIYPPQGNKCERCWVYEDEISQDPEESHLCHRCREVMKKY